MFNIPNFINHNMTERMVEIPVHKKVREKIKSVKGIKSYSQFFEDLLANKMSFET